MAIVQQNTNQWSQSDFEQSFQGGTDTSPLMTMQGIKLDNCDLVQAIAENGGGFKFQALAKNIKEVLETNPEARKELNLQINQMVIKRS